MGKQKQNSQYRSVHWAINSAWGLPCDFSVTKAVKLGFQGH